MASEPETELVPAQYAYHASRGTEMHLAEDYGSAPWHTRRGRYVYLASLDVSGALDTVPRARHTGTLREVQIEPYILRFLENWPAERRFWVRLE